ncbi:flagellar biosynthesis anti-sigma factor FlgM [Pseudomonas laurentiana]|uniref:Negative regulator of flagellin synthesis n=1 Tax=Pseudomonas laurentiana TaxID=2364649 RepID=A0A6I5RRT9_9PSED|nr:flagellar biosynthesis anti-sigma factor FlgM [Pseudomonas laurentiana]NES10842.1 flagellar biosynthesis anti-sigma factor FlgM [Pseudomonas laurentiana]GGU65908.1 flagellar biosynthesis anti-sigma factor FlgM [Pseudomonas laurentiana]
MVIDFSRLNNSPSVTSGARTGNSPESSASTASASTTAAASTQSGETVHLSQEAQQLQKISEKLREQPVVNSARVAELKQAIADGSYKIDSNRIASKLLNFEAQR